MIEINKIHLMDCIEGMKQIPDGSIDAVISDPPYGISFLGQWTDNHHEIANDGHDDFLDCLGSWLDQFHRITKKDSVCCCFCGGGGKTPVSAEFTMELPKHGFQIIQTLIWDKKTIGLGWRYRPSYETILVFCKDRDNFRWCTDRKDVSNILRYNNIIPQKGDHPTPKPVNLMRELVRLHTNEGDLVLDPFMGSGTTAVACIKEKRNFIGFEIDKGYHKIATKRVENEQSQLTLF